MSIEAMKQAIEALNYIEGNYMSLPKVGIEAITSLRQAIAEAEKQEPVAEIHSSKLRWIALEEHRPTNAMLYTHPQPKREPVIDKSAAIRIATALGWEPKREWVGLTDDERETILKKSSTYTWKAIELVEAKLKEKNT